MTLANSASKSPFRNTATDPIVERIQMCVRR